MIVSGDKVTEITYNDSGYSDDIVSDFGYNTELLDESGNIYLRARYYNSRIGQFIQVDSYRGSSTSLESQNRYLYGLNNPYRYVDWDGNVAVDESILFGGSKTTTKSTQVNMLVDSKGSTLDITLPFPNIIKPPTISTDDSLLPTNVVGNHTRVLDPTVCSNSVLSWVDNIISGVCKVVAEANKIILDVKLEIADKVGNNNWEYS